MTRLKQDVRADIVEKIAGHEGYLSGAYDKLTTEELEQGYKKGVNNLLIFETSSNESIKKLDDRIKEKDKTVNEMKQQMQDMRIQIIELQLALGKEKEKNGKK